MGPRPAVQGWDAIYLTRSKRPAENQHPQTRPLWLGRLFWDDVVAKPKPGEACSLLPCPARLLCLTCRRVRPRWLT